MSLLSHDVDAFVMVISYATQIEAKNRKNL